MKIRIISGGSPSSTRVVDADTGQELEGVVSVDWGVSLSHIAEARITLVNVAIDAVGDVEEITVQRPK